MGNFVQNSSMELNETRYNTETLQLIYSDAEKHQQALTQSFREVTNKSYILMSLLISTMSGLLAVLINNPNNTLTLVLFLLLLIPLGFLVPNTLPTAFGFPGAEPRNVIHEYFEREKKDQLHKLLAQRIIDTQRMIDVCWEVVAKRNRLFCYAINSAVAVLLFTLCLWLCTFFS